MLPSKPNITFISFSSIVDPQDVDHIFYYSIAADIYQEKVLKAYPFNKVFSFNIHTRKHSSYKTVGNISYYQYPVAKWRRLIDSFQFAFSINKKIPSNNAVLLYNVYTRSLPIFYFLKYVRRLKIYVLLADFEDPQKSFLNKLLSATIKQADGILSLNSNIRIHPNTVLQELLIDDTKSSYIQASHPGSMHQILFSGTIALDTGIAIALQAMHFLPEYTLHISGQLSEISEVEFTKLLSGAPHNIIYHGKVSTEQYAQLLQQCAVCLSLRNPNDGDQQYNFPSKIGEFLLHQKIVISSIIYPGFEEFLVYTQWDSSKVAEAIRQAKPAKDATTWLCKRFSLQKFQENLNLLIS